MARLPRILMLLCVAAAHLPSASPVLRSALVVRSGQSASLTCNLTSTDITWYLLRSDQLLPLLTVSLNKVGEEMVDFHLADGRRVYGAGAPGNGSVGLEILRVEGMDAGLYMCSGRCEGTVCFDRGIRVIVDAVEGEPAQPPGWTPGFCVAPASLVLCVVVVVVVVIAGFYLCSGKPAVCCCDSVRSNTSVKITEEEHYSCVNLADGPRPPGRGESGLRQEEVTYSTVFGLTPNGSHDHR